MWAERLVPRKHGLSSVTLSVTLMSKETVTFRFDNLCQIAFQMFKVDAA